MRIVSRIVLGIVILIVFLVITASIVTALIPGSQLIQPAPPVIIAIVVVGGLIAATQIAGMFGYTLKDFFQAIQPKSSQKNEARKRLLKSGQPQLLRDAAKKAYADKDYAWALTIAQSLLKLRPDDIIGHETAGHSLRLLDRANEAVAIGQKLIQIQPDLYTGYELVAASYRDLHKWEEAIFFYENAFTHASFGFKPFILYELSELYETTGDLVRAIECQEQYAESHVLGSRDKHEARLRLRSLQDAQKRAIKPKDNTL